MQPDSLERPLRPVDLPDIGIPPHWTASTKQAALGAFTLAHFVIQAIRAWGHRIEIPRVRIELDRERRESEAALLQQEMRIKDARFARIPPQNRPHYSNDERFAILALKAARGWSITRTARQFLVSPPTIASWIKKVDTDLLVAPPGPVNEFPDYVTYLVQKLKLCYPLLGYRSIANWLAQGGFTIAPTTIRRMLDKPLRKRPKPPFFTRRKNSSDQHLVASKHPGHMWNVDITTVPTSSGLAISWWPFAWPAVFPYCFKVIAVKDHFSRKVLALVPFRKEPSAADVTAVLDLAVSRDGRAPRHIISDKGSQFWNSKGKKASAVFADWLREHGVRPRFGAVGRKGSIAIVERFFRTLKQEGTRRMLVPYRMTEFEDEFETFREWFNTRRPHSALAGATPSDMHSGLPPPSERPRFETRARYPVAEEALASGKVQRVDFIALRASAFHGRKHLPDVRLDVAA